MGQVVKATALSKVYFLGKTLVNALSNVDLDVQKGEFLAIVGPSGSGKTTLLNLIGCLDQPTKGRLEISGQDVTNMKSDQLANIRNREIGFIFQTFNLIPVLTAYENVEFPLLLGNCSPKDRRKRVYKALEEVGIAEQQKHRPDELSGGQRQRVAIARALVKDPKIILADEPTANLDSATGDNIIKQMLEINRQRGTSFVFATHDPMVMKHASTVIKLHDGRRQNHGIY